MRNFFIIILLSVFLCNTSFADMYFFKQCKISNAVVGNYTINLKKNTIDVELKTGDGTVQNFSDKIKSIEKNKIISEKIKSAKGEEIYYQYFLNSKSKSVVKLEYKKESGIDMEIFKLNGKRVSYCMDVKSDWYKEKIEKAKVNKEEEEILKAQEELKKEQESVFTCQGNDIKEWTNCKGSYKAGSGHKYKGLFKNGKIIKGISIYPGGARYLGDFKNFEPHGEGTLFYPDGKKYEGEFVNGKRHGKGTFTYSDGSAYIGSFNSGIEQGVGDCVSPEGSIVKCKDKEETQAKDFSGKDIRKIEIVARKWVRISQYESNTKRGKKVMDKLKADFEIKAKELCLPKSNYNVLEKKIEVLDLDETPAYGLETKVKLAANGVVECI